MHDFPEKELYQVLKCSNLMMLIQYFELVWYWFWVYSPRSIIKLIILIRLEMAHYLLGGRYGHETFLSQMCFNCFVDVFLFYHGYIFFPFFGLLCTLHHGTFLNCNQEMASFFFFLTQTFHSCCFFKRFSVVAQTVFSLNNCPCPHPQ